MSSNNPANFSSVKSFKETEELIGFFLQKDFFKEKFNQFPIIFEHFSLAGQGFLLSLAINFILNKRKNQSFRIWVACNGDKEKDFFFHELRNWHCKAHFFPERINAQFEAMIPDPEREAERLEILRIMSKKNFDEFVLLLNVASFHEQVANRNFFNKKKLCFSLGQKINIQDLIDKCKKAGYERTVQIFERGQFALRGGIFDIFSWHSPLPLRFEFFDNELESIRKFDVDLQTSLQKLERAEIVLNTGEILASSCKLKNYVGENDIIFAMNLKKDDFKILPKFHFSISEGFFPINLQKNKKIKKIHEVDEFSCFENPIGKYLVGDFVLHENLRKNFIEKLSVWQKECWKIALFFNNEGEFERFSELMPNFFIQFSHVDCYLGNILQGFSLPNIKFACLTSSELFGRYQSGVNFLGHRRDNLAYKRQFSMLSLSLSDFKKGDLVVHQDYGIAKYLGVQKRNIKSAKGDNLKEVAVMKFAHGAQLYLQIEKIHNLTKYIGVGKHVKLSKLGDKRWKRQLAKAERSIMEYASQLLNMQAKREFLHGIAHEADSQWAREFEQSFIYEETKDQLNSIIETKHDMESTKPMERLICGDVGFGKTEVAIRAAFKAIMSGYQVSFLAPTTVLSNQHFHTFEERFSDYPFKIALLNRFRTQKEQKKTIEKIKNGEIDLVIGTHRIFSKDVKFKNLGLVVIDEEQRFGVKHKEKFKELFNLVDVLTLSATPIPRTLYLSLTGVRDMSQISTPPGNRLPVKTKIFPYNEKIIRDAINREKKRGGQVFFLHNRVKTIEKIKKKIQKLCPQVKIAIGHGQMEKRQLESIMEDFIARKYDVLVATTIIESGLDIPNANTIIIDRADRFGLADLYQLRGRVGRAGTQAYAILLLPPRGRFTTGDARKRIYAIKEHSKLGEGFKIAMRDLEIRGAGNMLGTKQSGHIAALGFELYCQLLKISVSKLKGKNNTNALSVAFYADFLIMSEAQYLKNDNKNHQKAPCFIPQQYMPETNLRIQGYRNLAEINKLSELNKLTKNWQDRFGKIPLAINNLLKVKEICIIGAKKELDLIEIKQNKLMLQKNKQFIQQKGNFPRLNKTEAYQKLCQAL